MGTCRLGSAPCHGRDHTIQYVRFSSSRFGQSRFDVLNRNSVKSVSRNGVPSAPGSCLAWLRIQQVLNNSHEAILSVRLIERSSEGPVHFNYSALFRSHRNWHKLSISSVACVGAFNGPCV